MLGGIFPLLILGKSTGTGTGGGSGRYFRAGYSYRRRIVIPATAHRLATGDGGFVLPILATETAWRSVGNGGQVASSLGYDMLFETEAGAKFAHDLPSYDAVTGRCEFWVRFLPAAASDNISLYLTWGNAAVTAPEAQPLAVWAGFLASWDLTTGLDAGPNAVHLAVTDVVPTTLLDMAAGGFSG